MHQVAKLLGLVQAGAWFLGGVVSAAALPPVRLVEDLRLTPTSSSFPQLLNTAPLEALGLAVIDTSSGHEQLWVSDGTPAGTRPLFAPCELPFFLTEQSALLGQVMAGRYWFNGCGLHASDGTPEGLRTPGLVAGTWNSNSELLGELPGVGRVALFARRFDGQSGLWATDGTSAGSVFLAPLQRISIGANRVLTARHPDGRLALVAFNPATGNNEPWVTNGTPGGTVRLGNLLAGGAPISWDQVAWLGDRVLIALTKAGGRELWSADGRGSGAPVRLFDAAATSAVWSGERRGYFLVPPTAGEGEDLWVTDGTVGGTRRVALLPGEEDAFPNFPRIQGERALVVGERLYLVGRASMWTSDGTPVGTRALNLFPPFDLSFSITLGALDPQHALVLGANGSQASFWRVDAAGGAPVQFFGCLGGNPVCPEEVGRVQALRPGDVVLSGSRGGDPEIVLWRSDGTSAGTREWLTLAPELTAGGLHQLAEGDFLAWIFDSAARRQTWTRIDETSGAFTPLLELGSTAPKPSSNPLALVATSSRLLFRAVGDAETFDTWGTSGATGGAQRLPTGSPSPQLPGVRVGEQVLAPQSAAPGVGFWVSDGTAAGTRSLTPDPTPASGFYAPLTFAGEALVVAGDHVFASRIHEGRTVRVGSLGSEGQRVRFLSNFVALGDWVYFFEFLLVRVGEPLEPVGRLWRTDGTALELVREDTGTLTGGLDLVALGNRLVYFNGGGLNAMTTSGVEEVLGPIPVATSLPFASPELRVAGSRVLLLRSPATGAEIWRSSGQAGAVERVFQGPGLVIETQVIPPVALGARVLFVASEANGDAELWVSDGTTAGTSKLVDLWPGPGPSWPHELTVIGGRAYFRAFTPQHGVELWATDGTAAGTSRLTDLHPGALSSAPGSFAVLDGELFFAADDGTHGRELFALPADAVGEPPSVNVPPPPGPWLTSPAVAGFRFKVQIAGGGGTLAGVVVPACLPETLCVSGAVPGRVEVMLRVVGPRPNGFLWPTMVKLTTSQVEVWVEQGTSGAVRYYLLEGARPGFDELNGLFDRMGFTP